MKKTVLLIFGILFLNMNAIAQTEVAPSVGDGSEGSPYEIATINNLYWISQNSTEWSKHYIQTADIDASASSGWDGGSGWTPIGNGTTNFTGSYDGQSFTINGLYISRSGSDYIGLFGYVEGDTISNLGVTNLDITGSSFAGGLVGYNNNSSVQNSYSTGSVSGSGNQVGGLVGSNENSSAIQNSYSASSVSGNLGVGGLVGYNSNGSTVENSYSTGSVIGSNNQVGGLMGYNNNSDVQNSYSTGSVSGSGNKVGGLVGYNINGGTVENSYSTGSVSGSSNQVGGLVGSNESSTIKNSYSAGSVTGSGIQIGGLVGYHFSSTVTNSFWDTETSGQGGSASGTGKTTAQMQTQSTFTDAGWDFTDETANGTNDHWDFNGSISGYPFLAWQNSMSYAIPALNTDLQSFAAAGASVQFTAGNTGEIQLNIIRTESEPNIEGSLPGSVQNLSPRYWSATLTSGSVTSTYNITLDLTGVSGINDCSTLYVLKRDNSSSPWQDVVADLGATLNRNDCPNSITIQGLTGFSDFVIGGGNDNPLPVELVSYTLENQDNTVKLNWKTAAEVDNQGFILERSEQPNQGFKQVASYQSSSNLKGQGTVSQETSYEYVDYGKFKHGETYYYRLSDVDIAGNRNVLETKAITRPDAYSLGQNYPNPFNPVTTITFSLQKPGKTVLEVYNILGQKVKTLLNDELKVGTHIQRWDARGYASGVYFYRLQSGSFTQIKKMMLVK